MLYPVTPVSSVDAAQPTSISVGLTPVAVTLEGTVGACVSPELVVVTTSCGLFVASLLDMLSAVLLVVVSARLSLWPGEASGVTSTLVHELRATGPDEPVLVGASAGALL